EVMTGYLNNGTNPLSRVTVASLADLGYQVNMNAADAYTPPGRALIAGSGSGSGSGTGLRSLQSPGDPGSAPRPAAPPNTVTDWFATLGRFSGVAVDAGYTGPLFAPPAAVAPFADPFGNV